jgi:hypothetical protein
MLLILPTMIVLNKNEIQGVKKDVDGQKFAGSFVPVIDWRGFL